MTATRHPVGPSSYDDGTSTSPFGKVQHVSSAFVAAQVSSLCYEFDTQFPGALERGDRLTVNEGIREKRRMEILRAAWETYLRNGTPFAALAAALYFSTHREEIGSALDFGITTKDGSNRAMTAGEAEWVHQHGVPRGIVHTGARFNPPESWHHNGGYAYSLPPITGVNQPGERFYTSSSITPNTKESKPLMKIIHSPKGHTLLTEKGAYKFDPLRVGKQTILGTQQIKLMQRVIDAKDENVLTDATEFGDAEVDIIAAVLRKVK